MAAVRPFIRPSKRSLVTNFGPRSVDSVEWKYVSSRDYNFPVRSIRLGLAVREFGAYIDKVGSRMMGHYSYLEQLNRHKRVNHFRTWLPQIDSDCFIAPSAAVIGEVTLYKNVGIWYSSVIRADFNPVIIGSKTQIQEKCTIRGGYKWETRIGTRVLVEPGCVIYGAAIADGARIGSGCIVMENALVGENAQLASGSVLSRDSEMGPRELWEGTPAKFVRLLTDAEVDYNERVHDTVLDLASEHREECNKPYEQVVTERDVKIFYRMLDAERQYYWAK